MEPRSPHETIIERLLEKDCGIDAHLEEFERDKLQRLPRREIYDVELTGNGPIRNELHLRRNHSEEFRPDPNEDRVNPEARRTRLDGCIRYGY